jgi:hypothetical protein
MLDQEDRIRTNKENVRPKQAEQFVRPCNSKRGFDEESQAGPTTNNEKDSE